MLVKGNKIYRNLQEQVGENQKNIEELQSLIGVGINVKYVVDTIADLSDIEDPEEGSFAAVGMAKPYTLFLFKGNVWIDFGLFPSPGPQGTPGTNGTNGTNGQDAGFGSITTTTTTTSPENPAAVSVETSGPNTAKNIQFNFTIPKGDKGERGERGYRGYKGDPGEQGPEGPAGPTIYRHRIVFETYNNDTEDETDVIIVWLSSDSTEIDSTNILTKLSSVSGYYINCVIWDVDDTGSQGPGVVSIYEFESQIGISFNGRVISKDISVTVPQDSNIGSLYDDVSEL